MNCVEVACVADEVLMRNSRFADGVTHSFTREEWNAFIEGVKHGEFDVSILRSTSAQTV